MMMMMSMEMMIDSDMGALDRVGTPWLERVIRLQTLYSYSVNNSIYCRHSICQQQP